MKIATCFSESLVLCNQGRRRINKPKFIIKHIEIHFSIPGFIWDTSTVPGMTSNVSETGVVTLLSTSSGVRSSWPKPTFALTRILPALIYQKYFHRCMVAINGIMTNRKLVYNVMILSKHNDARSKILLLVHIHTMYPWLKLI